eukprot:TRINITY_DN2630_c1_g2_i1.p1 TRINITY_DN2630_c1_g2~~TRINITY_DN2630_c1_g2_i1.p1  ORF type:complete len:429 (+),score=104.83 TRINITY_DN2630_c1_g2_i1:53-1288(+)
MAGGDVIHKVAKADILNRVTDNGLRWCYFMKLYNYCADRWQRIATNVFLQSIQMFRRGCARRVMAYYFEKLRYYKYVRAAAGNGGAEKKKVAVVQHGNNNGTNNSRNYPSETPKRLPNATPGSPGRDGEYKVRIACDVYGVKRNVKVSLTERPELDTLVNIIESQYDAVCRGSRPAGFPDVPFKVQSIQIFSQLDQKWAELTKVDQLHSGCQLYVFPPESYWHSDSQGVIPEAVDVFAWKTAEASPHRNRMPSRDVELSAPGAEKARFVFYDMAPPGNDKLKIADLVAGFEKCDMIFDASTALSLFDTADMNHDGVITISEWLSFASRSANVIDALYFRIKDYYSSRRHVPTMSLYSDPTSPSYYSSHDLQYAKEYQIACQEAAEARERQRLAEAREAAARERLRQVHSHY